ncbi:probable cation-transporting ATPase 13A3 [Pollicipes pollicipes]|uniref:probable cation-transporting ATPase 13A3 n=1 Tax=Pollicipes pollicipes TaxID=41117 RepID=UPI001884E395|nr:probable cation-transporting ATPase 13A3 [Pollicipes pollicipes]
MVVPEVAPTGARGYGAIAPAEPAARGDKGSVDGGRGGRGGSFRYEPLALDEGLRHRAVIGKGTEEELVVRGYCRSLPLSAIFWVGSLALGLWPLLVTYWRPDWRLRLTHGRCPLWCATAVLLTDLHGRTSVESVVSERAGPATPPPFRIRRTAAEAADRSPLLLHQDEDEDHIRYFWSYHLKYTWNHETGCFVQLSGLDRGVRVSQLLENYNGYSPAEQADRLSLYGENRITVQVKSYLRLLVEEALNPFYIFQVCSLTLWALDDYEIYATCIFVISVISIGVSLYETRKQSETLRDMVLASAVSTVTVRRSDGEVVELGCERLVPGDVLVLPESGCSMACDAVLVAGSCIVNESMLTGESVPVTKTQLTCGEEGELFSPESHKRHTLFCGTQVIQTRFYGNSPGQGHCQVLAVVIRTGFSTAKGELIRSILFPKPMGFKFYQDSMRFIGFLFLLSVSGLAYTVYLYVIRGASVRHTVLRALDIITIAVPPALPAAMTVGTVYAQNRLKVASIFCISPPRINVCGKLKLFCFDKTGTLTEDGLSMWGVVPCSPAGFAPPERHVPALSDRSELKVALAACHGLTRLAGQLIGDPLDVKMFEATDWVSTATVACSARHPTQPGGRSGGDVTGTRPVAGGCRQHPAKRDWWWANEDQKAAFMGCGCVTHMW